MLHNNQNVTLQVIQFTYTIKFTQNNIQYMQKLVQPSKMAIYLPNKVTSGLLTISVWARRPLPLPLRLPLGMITCKNKGNGVRQNYVSVITT